MKTTKAKEKARALAIKTIASKYGDNVHSAKAPRDWATQVHDALDMDVVDDDDIHEYIVMRGWWCDENETEE